MRKYSKVSLFILISFITYTLFGCSNLNKNTSSVQAPDNVSTYHERSLASDTSSEQSLNDQNEYQNHQIVFPISDKGKTKNNAAIYEIEPFTLQIDFPKDWSTKETEQRVVETAEYHYLNYSLFSLIDVFDDNNNCVGTIGYNTYENTSTIKDNPEAIYSFIGIGNNYQFDVRNAYNVVFKTEKGDTAITDVLYSESFLRDIDAEMLKNTRKVDSDDSEYLLKNHEGFGTYYNKGILSYDKNREVYIAMEIDKSVVTEEQLVTIAKSISFLE